MTPRDKSRGAFTTEEELLEAIEDEDRRIEVEVASSWGFSVAISKQEAIDLYKYVNGRVILWEHDDGKGISIDVWE